MIRESSISGVLPPGISVSSVQVEEAFLRLVMIGAASSHCMIIPWLMTGQRDSPFATSMIRYWKSVKRLGVIATSVSIRSRRLMNLFSFENVPFVPGHLLFALEKSRIFAVSVYICCIYFTSSGVGHFSIVHADTYSLPREKREEKSTIRMKSEWVYIAKIWGIREVWYPWQRVQLWYWISCSSYSPYMPGSLWHR